MADFSLVSWNARALLAGVGKLRAKKIDVFKKLAARNEECLSTMCIYPKPKQLDLNLALMFK